MINPSTNPMSYLLVLTLILLVFHIIYCCFTPNDANNDTQSPIPFETVIDKLNKITNSIK